MTLYIFVYRTTGDFEDDRRLTAFVDNAKHMEAWHKPFPGLFFIESHVESNLLSRSFLDFLGPNVPFLVGKYPSGLSTGHLPDTVWQWISSHIEGQPNIVKFDRDGVERDVTE